MKKITGLMLCIAVAMTLTAQNTESDSLKRILATTKEDTTHVLALFELARYYEFFRPDTAMFYARQALQLANKLHFKKGEAKSLDEMAYLLTLTGNYPKALETAFKSLQINEERDDQFGIAVSYNTIALIYIEQGDYRQALNYLFKSKAIVEKLKIESSIIIRNENIADVYEKMNLPDSALIFENNAFKMRFIINDMNQMNVTLLNLGNIHSKLGHTAFAMDYYRQSIPYSEADEDIDGLAETWLGMAKLFKQSGKPDSALYYAGRAFKSAQSVSGYKKMMLASGFLANAYEEKQNTDSAFRYFKIVMATKDTLFSEEKIKQVQNLSFNEQLRQQEIAEEKAKAEEERRNNLQMMAMAVFILTFFIAVIILSRRKTKARTMEFLGLLALLLLFEFIALFLHPYIAAWTNHIPVLMLMALVLIAAVLVPLHHRLSHWVKGKLTGIHNIQHETG